MASFADADSNVVNRIEPDPGERERLRYREIHVAKMSLRTFMSVECRSRETAVKRKKAHFHQGKRTTRMLTPFVSPCEKTVNSGQIGTYEIRRRSAEDQP